MALNGSASRRWAWVCILAATLSTGCYGKCVSTTTVVKWHGDLDMNKWAKEAIYLPLFFFVLPFTSLVDHLVLNAIDFFTTEGDPLAAIPAPAPGGETALLK